MNECILRLISKNITLFFEEQIFNICIPSTLLEIFIVTENKKLFVIIVQHFTLQFHVWNFTKSLHFCWQVQILANLLSLLAKTFVTSLSLQYIFPIHFVNTLQANIHRRNARTYVSVCESQSEIVYSLGAEQQRPDDRGIETAPLRRRMLRTVDGCSLDRERGIHSRARDLDCIRQDTISEVFICGTSRSPQGHMRVLMSLVQLIIG